MKSLCSASVFSRLCNCILYLSSWVFFSCINPTSCCCWLSRCFAMLFNRLRAPIAWGGGFIGIKRIKTLFISYQGDLKLFWSASLISETTQGNILISIHRTNFNWRRGQIQCLWWESYWSSNNVWSSLKWLSNDFKMRTLSFSLSTSVDKLSMRSIKPPTMVWKSSISVKRQLVRFNWPVRNYDKKIISMSKIA